MAMTTKVRLLVTVLSIKMMVIMVKSMIFKALLFFSVYSLIDCFILQETTFRPATRTKEAVVYGSR